MSVATAPPWEQRASPSTRDGVVRLGMPHLTIDGLSESWLLKDLGDRHWRLIAEAAGFADPDFRDIDGAAVYPAFCGTSIAAARFDLLGEHDDLVIASELARVSTTQFASRHRLACRGVPVGVVTLSSVFVKRHKAGQNRVLARIAPEHLPPLPICRDFAPITALASRLRASPGLAHFGFPADVGDACGQVGFRPCPSQDFNGAGFLYFPSFSAFVDRAEWALFAWLGLVTVARDVVYHGNIDVGETLVIDVVGLRRSGAGLSHRCRISAGDGRRLADVFTHRVTRGP